MKIKLSHSFYYMFLVCVTLYYAFRRTTVDYTIFNFAMYLAIPLILLKVVSEKYRLKEAVVILVLAVIGIISAFTIREVTVLVAFCVVIGSKNIDYRVGLKIVFWMRLMITILLGLLSIMNVIENRVKIRNGVTRYALGYSHPNMFGIHCFMLLSLWFILYGEKRWKWKIYVTIAVNVIQYKITNSRTAFIIICLFIILEVLSKGTWNIEVFKKVALASFGMGIVFSIIIPLIYVPYGIMYQLNRMLSSRISLSKSYMKVYGFKIFGSAIGMNTTEEHYWALDSGYLHLFIKCGMLASCLFLILFIALCKMDLPCNESIYISMIAFSVYGLMEDVLCSFRIDYLWIIMGYVFFELMEEREDLVAKFRLKQVAGWQA